ncbi:MULTISPECIES: hypothetical protein [unclassified Leeuwenhoekiella]|uniref:hypothetical protein n=1 Tax=unclassified Leeuwenhoekiella TaxID=2615029 RepID=UPI000C5E6438|nr:MULTISPECIES: hypothetical protein [unclassified Leeuwenhoekiella]MAW97122.1 hypothetical protein [Leeuwenhoekiella sp.]MBA82638.1 hypothetical protein [Leeuwenhoekiella sp.]|tara:strand:+ start:1106 stop:1864 length:759 start_codon:yes stop_codon:yes gene_type:complete
MPRIFSCLFIIFIGVKTHSQTTAGKVYANDKTKESVLIINTTQDKMVSTDKWGNFEIVAAVGDSLIFSASFFGTQKFRVQPYQLKEQWVVELKEVLNELDEVRLTGTTPKIEEFNVEEYDKNFNDWLQEDIQKNWFLYSPKPTSSGIDFIAIAKLIFKNKKKRKKEKPDPNRFRVLELEELVAFFKTDDFFDENLLRNQLQISAKQEGMFFDYCESQQFDARLLQEKNQLRFLDYLLKLSKEFHQLSQETLD